MNKEELIAAIKGQGIVTDFVLTKYDKTPQLDRAQVEEAIWVCQGNIIKLAAFLGITYSDLRTYIDADEELLKLITTVREYRNEGRLDILEDLAMQHAIAGDVTVLKRLLDVYGKKRGFGEAKTIELKSAPEHITALISSLKDLQASNDDVKL